MKKPIVQYRRGVEIVIGEIDTETGEKKMFDEAPPAAEPKAKKDGGK